MKTKLIIWWFLAALVMSITPVPAGGASTQLELSLRQRTEKGERVFDILVTNVSSTSVEIVSEGIAPPWSVWAWFKWEVDGKDAEYLENVVGIFPGRQWKEGNGFVLDAGAKLPGKPKIDLSVMPGKIEVGP